MMSSYGMVRITGEKELTSTGPKTKTDLGTTQLHMVESETGAYLAFHDGTNWRRVESSIIEFPEEKP